MKINFNKGIIIRFLLIFLIALYINFYVLPDLKIPSNEIEKISINGTNYLDIKGYFDLTQEDLNSGNLNTIFWKLIYLGNARDKICFEKDVSIKDQSFYGSYNKGESYEIIRKECFTISKNEDKITFDVKYVFHIDFNEFLSDIEPLPPVNKSDCFPETINEETQTCLTQQGIDNAKRIVLSPRGEVYLEANLFHKLIKFVFIFFSTGGLLWIFSRTFYLIKYGWDKK